MSLTPRDAQMALASIQESQAAMRHAFRAHRGHLHLWLWGAIWIAMAIAAHLGGPSAIRWFPLLAFAGGLASAVIGFRQRHQIRLGIDRRFVGALASLLAFGAIWPFVLRPAAVNEAIFAYIGLLVAQAYVVAGLWFDTYLTWMGLVLAVLLLAGLAFFLPYFWIWVAVFGGGSLLAGGCYVRFVWE